jgi:hypothetical protein
MKGYTTKTKIENYTLTEIDISFNDQIDTWIEAIENYIDKVTGRNFIADTSASERLFNGNGSRNLPIDDCISVTKVEKGNNSYGDSFREIDEEVAGGYYLLPENYSEKGLPIDMIHLRGSLWNKGLKNHRITAKWGYSEEVPKDIEFATTVFVNGIINKTNVTKGDISSEKIGDYSVSYKSEKEKSDYIRALEILEKYKSYQL